MAEIKDTGILGLRKQLDAVDTKLVELFIQRLGIVNEICSIKMERGLPVFDREREDHILNERMRNIENEQMYDSVRRFLSGILEISKDGQHRILESGKESSQSVPVAYQGVPGSYSHQAATQYFKGYFSGFPQESFKDVFTVITEGNARYGVLPLENSSTGSIVEVYDLIIRYGCYIVGEEIVEVDHCLLGMEGAVIDDITTVFSHEQGLSQCQGYISRHPSWEQIIYKNTAISAKHVADSKNKHWAAIASKQAAKYYGLKILDERIQDQHHNYTRFIVVSPHLRRDDNCNKVSLCFVLKHESGSLANIITIFAKNNLNMVKIESRPIPGEPWQYRFYVDVESNMEQPQLQNALAALGLHSHEWRLLGNYPKAVLSL